MSERSIELLHFGYHAAIAHSRRLLAEAGLSRVHHRMLYIIRKRPGISVGALIVANQVSRQAAHKPLRELRERGFVALEVAEHDRRSRTLVLTPEGRAFEARLTRSIQSRFEAAFDAVGPRAAAGWQAVMQQLVALERDRGEAEGNPELGEGWV